jgi:hypothetical protein
MFSEQRIIVATAYASIVATAMLISFVVDHLQDNDTPAGSEQDIGSSTASAHASA